MFSGARCDDRSKVVYRFSVDSSQFALAIMKPMDLINEDRAIRVFEGEITILSQLSHPNIIKVFGVAENRIGFLMEYIGGNE